MHRQSDMNLSFLGSLWRARLLAMSMSITSADCLDFVNAASRWLSAFNTPKDDPTEQEHAEDLDLLGCFHI